MRSYLLALAIALFLSGCASPLYQTVYRYEAPTDASARACLQTCEPKLAACQTSCQHRYQSCLKEIEPLVDTRHSEALKRYENELDRYRLELQHYQLQLSLGWGYHSLWYDPWPYWHPTYFPPPIPPHKPTRDEAYNRVRKERCESDCGCQPIYDACFLSCGGKMIPEVKCIANCPQEK
ncbi:MAG: hypothetical protein AABY73_12390 [Pseudomonadota bacterium]